MAATVRNTAVSRYFLTVQLPNSRYPAYRWGVYDVELGSVVAYFTSRKAAIQAARERYENRVAQAVAKYDRSYSGEGS